MQSVSEYLDQNIWIKENEAVPDEWVRLKKIKQNTKIVKYLKMLKFE